MGDANVCKNRGAVPVSSREGRPNKSLLMVSLESSFEHVEEVRIDSEIEASEKIFIHGLDGDVVLYLFSSSGRCRLHPMLPDLKSTWGSTTTLSTHRDTQHSAANRCSHFR